MLGMAKIGKRSFLKRIFIGKRSKTDNKFCRKRSLFN